MLTLNAFLNLVSTAVLTSCGVALWIMLRRIAPDTGEDQWSRVLAAHRRMSGIFNFSLLMVTVTAVPRIIFFRAFEFDPAARDGSLQGLTLRHALTLLLLLFGLGLWISSSRRLRRGDQGR